MTKFQRYHVGEWVANLLLWILPLGGFVVMAKPILWDPDGFSWALAWQLGRLIMVPPISLIGLIYYAGRLMSQHPHRLAGYQMGLMIFYGLMLLIGLLMYTRLK